MKTLPQFIERGDPDVVGEMARALTFVGEGFGCYSNFDVRPDAREMARGAREDFWVALGDELEFAEEAAENGSGYVFEFADLTVHACWFWDGDGMLGYRVFDSDGTLLRSLYNGDCKKDYRWQDTETERVFS